MIRTMRFLAPATRKELAPPTLMSLVAQILNFFSLARADEAIELSPRDVAAIATFLRKFLLLTPDRES